MYTYLETDCTKDPDTEVSFLYHNNDYISNRLQESNNLKEIVLKSDNAGGQNKNHKMMFCYFLAVKFKVKVSQLYPVRGHSYCQCDRNFGAYSNVLRRTARMATSKDYDKIISIKI